MPFYFTVESRHSFGQLMSLRIRARIFLFFYYFNEFLFCYVLHFFYTLTYEHVGKIQKNGKKN